MPCCANSSSEKCDVRTNELQLPLRRSLMESKELKMWQVAEAMSSETNSRDSIASYLRMFLSNTLYGLRAARAQTH